METTNFVIEQKQYEDVDDCFCEKKQCMIGIASIAIGIGGFVIALLLE